MEPIEKVSHVGIVLLVGAVTYAVVREFVGVWFLPWLLLFWIGPTVGLLVWSFGGDPQ